MTVQDFTITTKENNLGITNPSPILSVLVVGLCTGLTHGIITTLSTGTLSTAGLGKGAELCSLVLNSGLSVVDVYPTAVDSSGARAPLPCATPSAAAGNLLGNASGTAYPTFTGSPNDDLLIRIEIITGGSTPVFRYSLDDGNSWVQQIVSTPGVAQVLYAANPGTTNAISSGVSVTLPTGTYVAGDVFNSFGFAGAAVVAMSTAGDGSIQDCLNQVAAGSKKYTHIVFAEDPNGTAVDATNFTSTAAALTQIGTQMLSLANTNFFSMAFVGTPRRETLGDELDVTYQGLATSMTPQSIYSRIGYGHTFRQSSISRASHWRSQMWAAVEREIQNANPKQTIYTSDAIPLSTPNLATLFTILNYSGILGSGSTADESKATNSLGGSFGAVTPSGFMALYRSSHASRPGSFTFLAGNSHCDPTNDYFESAYRMQFNAVLNLVFATMWLLFKGQNLDVNLATGNITPAQAADIEATIQRIVTETLVDPGYVQAPPPPGTVDSEGHPVNTNFIVIDQTVNLVTTGNLKWISTAWAPGYVKTFTAVSFISL